MESAVRQAVGMGVGLKELGQSVADSAIRVAIEIEQVDLVACGFRVGLSGRDLVHFESAAMAGRFLTFALRDERTSYLRETSVSAKK